MTFEIYTTENRSGIHIKVLFEDLGTSYFGFLLEVDKNKNFEFPKELLKKSLQIYLLFTEEYLTEIFESDKTEWGYEFYPEPDYDIGIDKKISGHLIFHLEFESKAEIELKQKSDVYTHTMTFQRTKE